jgi:hypothetical protein
VFVSRPHSAPGWYLTSQHSIIDGTDYLPTLQCAKQHVFYKSVEMQLGKPTARSSYQNAALGSLALHVTPPPRTAERAHVFVALSLKMQEQKQAMIVETLCCCIAGYVKLGSILLSACHKVFTDRSHFAARGQPSRTEIAIDRESLANYKPENSFRNHFTCTTSK